MNNGTTRPPREGDHRPALSPAELLKLEAEGEARNRKLVADSLANLGDRCPECGRLGSLEEADGVTRCVDCDLEVLNHAKLPGFGKR